VNVQIQCVLTDSFIILAILDTHADDWTKDYTLNVHKCSSMGSVVAYCYLLVVVVRGLAPLHPVFVPSL
jgi:hypothetical protein